MFKIIFANEFIKQIFLQKDRLEDSTREELLLYKRKLAKSGEVCGAEAVRMFPILEICYRVPCRNFNLVYVVYSKLKQIHLYGFELEPVHKLRELQDSLEDNWRSENDDLTIYIPQADRPEKIIRVLEVLSQDYCTSLEIGIKLGHKGKKAKDKARHGSYFGRALVELKLVDRYRKGNLYSYIYKLTEDGARIASCSDRWTQSKLLAEAMLKFYPIQVIFDEITIGKQPLTLDLVTDLVDQLLSPGNHKTKTLERRAKCLIRWITWISSVKGIFIHMPVANELQLCLPLFE